MSRLTHWVCVYVGSWYNSSTPWSLLCRFLLQLWSLAQDGSVRNRHYFGVISRQWEKLETHPAFLYTVYASHTYCNSSNMNVMDLVLYFHKQSKLDYKLHVELEHLKLVPVSFSIHPIPADIEHEAGYTLNRSPVNHRAYIHTQTTIHSHIHTFSQFSLQLT